MPVSGFSANSGGGNNLNDLSYNANEKRFEYEKNSGRLLSLSRGTENLLTSEGFVQVLESDPSRAKYAERNLFKSVFVTANKMEFTAHGTTNYNPATTVPGAIFFQLDPDAGDLTFNYPDAVNRNFVYRIEYFLHKYDHADNTIFCRQRASVKFEGLAEEEVWNDLTLDFSFKTGVVPYEWFINISGSDQPSNAVTINGAYLHIV